MDEARLDCRELPCPQPVLQCKNALTDSQPQRLVVTVDNDPARHNVTRFLASQGYRVVSLDTTDGLFILTAEPDQETGSIQTASSESAKEMPELTGAQESHSLDRQLVLITSDVIGHGDDALGEKLMQSFLATLPEMEGSLWRIILINAGVRLAVQGSSVLEHLQKLESAGVSILVCGTCLNHFQLLENKRIGETTNMLDVVTSLQLASKVIKV